MQAITEAPSAPTSPLDPQQLLSRPASLWRRLLDRGGSVDTICKREGRIRSSPSEYWYPPSWGFGVWTPRAPPTHSPYSEVVLGPPPPPPTSPHSKACDL